MFEVSLILIILVQRVENQQFLHLAKPNQTFSLHLSIQLDTAIPK